MVVQAMPGIANCATETQTAQTEHAFYQFFRINVLFFIELLALLQEDLTKVAVSPQMVDAELPMKITPMMTRVLPALRLYSRWLLLNTHLLVGLASNPLLTEPLHKFWRSYARVLDIIAAIFPIWDLEDCTPVAYMLQEDAEAFGFLPLQPEEQRIALLDKIWYDAKTGARRPRPGDVGSSVVEANDETLHRMLGLLEIGSFVANNVDDTPLSIRGTRFVLGQGAELFDLPRPPTPLPAQKPKPLSYAAAAARKTIAAAKKAAATDQSNSARSAVKTQVVNAQQDDQMSRMVDSLVEDEDTDNPVTPPQHFASSPNVINSASDLEFSIHVAPSPKLGYHSPGSPMALSPGLNQQDRRNSHPGAQEDLSDFVPRPKIHTRPGSSVGLWVASDEQGPHSSRKNSASPSHRLHNRVGSSASNASPRSPAFGSRWPSDENVPKQKHTKKTSFTSGTAATSALNKSLVAATPDRILDTPVQNPDASHGSPLLFGNGSIWSVVPQSKSRNEHGD